MELDKFMLDMHEKYLQRWEKFPEYNLRMLYRSFSIHDENNKVINKIDILQFNTEWVMAIKVITKLNKNDIDDHIVCMNQFLKKPPPGFIASKAKLLGAIAAGIITPEAAAYAHECGFFVLELKGESVIRVPAPADFKPKEYRVTGEFTVP